MAESTGSHQYGNIILAHRSGTSTGNLKVSSSGLTWKKAGAGKTVEIQQGDIEGFVWSKTSRGCQLAVKKSSGPMVQFLGFIDKDLTALRGVASVMNKEIEEQALSISGRNWGGATVEEGTLVFRVGNKPAFRIPLRDVGQVQLGREEVTLEFPVDDTAGGDNEDALTDMVFYVPREATGFVEDGEDQAAKVMYDQVLEHTDAGVATEDAVVTFDSLAVLIPRGRFDVELYPSFMKLLGQAQDFRIQYDSILRLFVLPKTNTPHTLVVVSLDPPIRKGQTHYYHILVQFPSDEERQIELELSDEALAAKNEKCGGKLQKTLEGPAYDVFAKALRGLSGCKLTKPGTFRTADEAGFAVRCSYKADDGYLYPLERAFFYIHKPPTLLVHDEIESIEFMRQGGGVLAASAKTFDLNIRMKTDNKPEYLFRGIQKSEWQNLFSFIQAKRLRIENLREAELGPAGGGTALDLGDDIDTGLAQMEAHGDLDDDSEEDADFDAGADSGAGEDDDDSGMSDDEDEETETKKKVAKAPKAKAEPKPKAEPKKRKPAPAKKDDKKKKAKKDPNAPKKALSAFMFFSSAKRDEVKKENPDISFGEVGKALGDKWKNISATEKAKYDEMAKKDKVRYAKAKEAYESKKKDEEEPKEEEDEDDEADDDEEDED
ncbi:SSrecog-domain-containing protein [Coccomyxa subellipsoidea C-169]|uniref:FACT complex subunit SSRP1 n=1 Tax=Coccomyxa subellipsoidea (strain C-169) TaxID=574566 RepID=I0YRW5_COCSC|nr:SSrecog-domain-containing protein [Coccomyxa subellipsoidea C-169]EIE21134.1 SSrecog-domain-containing protein [Coccomyxa subellipsoidea C-169]|eukprot:XP_005645678.1 SSrecog-domain-containing protein [Coccomyxa subellipsoidea C-169]